MDCTDCKDKGYIDSGNGDFPCHCKAGDKAIFNVAGRGQVSGKQLKKEEREMRKRPLDDYYK